MSRPELRRLSPWFLLYSLAACQPASQGQPAIEAYDPLPLVDPFIGTGGLGAEVVGLNPGAALPFGMTQTGPDTADSVTGSPNFYHFGGYFYEDDLITGFSHEHANGMGVNDFGTIAVLPRRGWTSDFITQSGRAAPFTHAAESSSPGFYSVTLQDDGTEVEIVATRYGAIHRYRFAEGDLAPTVILDLGHELGSVHVGQASIEGTLSSGEVNAYQLLQGAYSERFGGLKTWAHLRSEPLPDSGGTWNEDGLVSEGQFSAEGERAGLWFSFPAGTNEVTLRIALSHTDSQGAQSNFQNDLEGLSFDELHAAAEDEWRGELGRVRIGGGTAAQRTIFHTALYHASLWPNVMSDSDGRYRGFDDQIHQADFEYHTNFSMWDTFRTTHPWMTLTRPDKARDFARSLVRMYEDGGSMPRWALGHGYTGGMVGTPAAQILAGTWLKGVRDWDAETGFAACLAHATSAMPHASRAAIEQYRQLHYVPMEAGGGSTSLGIEYAWNDHALSLWADSLGRDEDAKMLTEQSRWWRNNWDPSQEFMVGRYADGSFHQISAPDRWLEEYVEGDAWHYLWPAPYDVEGMIALQHDGDDQAFRERLELYWYRVESEEDDTLPDTYYWHGNEPDIHHPWLGALAGFPELSTGPVRHVIETRYGTGPDGLDGNDDAGTLSSWYLFSSLGLYPVAGTPTYALASPLFERAEIDLPDTTLVISAPALPAQAQVPTRVEVGDQLLDVWMVEHAALRAGETLRFSFD